MLIGMRPSGSGRKSNPRLEGSRDTGAVSDHRGALVLQWRASACDPGAVVRFLLLRLAARPAERRSGRGDGLGPGIVEPVSAKVDRLNDARLRLLVIASGRKAAGLEALVSSPKRGAA